MALLREVWACRKLESLLGYHFKNRSLLKEACTHASWRENDCPCYQRLEFLGDAILDILVTHTLAERHKSAPPLLHLL